MKSLLKFSILMGGRRGEIKLYNEDGEYIWRLYDERGAEVKALPHPKTLFEGKIYSYWPDEKIYFYDSDNIWVYAKESINGGFIVEVYGEVSREGYELILASIDR